MKNNLTANSQSVIQISHKVYALAYIDLSENVQYQLSSFM